MKLIKIGICIVAILSSVAATLWIHTRAQSALAEENALLLQQERQIAELTTEQQRLSSARPTTKAPQLDDTQTQIAKLREQAAALRQQTNALIQEKQLKRAELAQSSAKSMERTEEYWQLQHKAAGSRPRDAMMVGEALYRYAEEHGKNAPHNIADLSSSFAKMDAEGRGWTGTNHFELLYQGSLDKLEGLPWGVIAVARSDIWTTPDGEPARVYSFLDSHSQIVSGEDHIREFEAKHVIIPAR